MDRKRRVDHPFREAHRHVGRQALEDRAEERRGLRVPGDFIRVVVDDQMSARPDVIVEPLDRQLGRRRVLNHPDARHDVEALLLERKRHDVGLRDTMHRPEGEVFDVRVDGLAQVDRRHTSAAIEEVLGESPGAAAAFEDVEPLEVVPEPVAEAAPEPVARDRHTGIGVELGQAIPFPLFAEVIGVGGGGDKARDPCDDGKAMPCGTAEVAALINKRVAVVGAREGGPLPPLPVGVPDTVLCRGAAQCGHCHSRTPAFTR